MTDPLAQFRKKPVVVSSTPPAAMATAEAYAAFGAKDRTERLRIRRAMAPTRSPSYNYLLDVLYDGSFGTNFSLLYTFMVVLVRGRNLQAVVSALEAGTADFIQEFDSDRWTRPDANAPFIESIEVVVQENAPVSEPGPKVH